MQTAKKDSETVWPIRSFDELSSYTHSSYKCKSRTAYDG